MSHNNLITDADAFFEVDIATRNIRNKTPAKNKLIQYDHNSERFTFSIPRYIEGHDMMECDKAEVHYINIDAVTGEKKEGIYDFEDLQEHPKSANKVVCSWLISGNATKYVGLLHFSLVFKCIAEDGETVEYAWHSAIYKEITISDGINNTEVISEQYADILAQWEARLFGINEDGVKNVTEASATAMKEINDAYENAIKTADGITEEIAQSKETALDQISGATESGLGNIASGISAIEDATHNALNEINEVAENVEEIAIHQPIIVQNNWWVWDAEKKNYVDTGVRATVDIVQTTGESETDVMSQKATTEALLNLANKVAPSPASVSIYANEWEQDDEEPRWHQVVEVANATITSRSKVDLQPSAEQLTVFYEKSLAFVTENDNGVVTVYCIGQKPENDYTIQVTVSEVVV